jgi:hypothetical protein
MFVDIKITYLEQQLEQIEKSISWMTKHSYKNIRFLTHKE